MVAAPMSLRPVFFFVWVTIATTGACSSDESTPQGDSSTGVAESSTGDASPHALLLAAVPNTVCDDPKVVSAELRAVKVGCEDPPPAPCTVPSVPVPIVGDRKSCPITDATVTLGVRIEVAAEYEVEAVLERAPDAPDGLCFGDPDLETSVVVTSEDIAARAQKMLEGTGRACPDE
jgi:hypothetical protein